MNITMTRPRGRPMLQIPYREPNGRPSRAKEPPDAIALEARARQFGLTLNEAKNQLAATFVGRLHMQYQAWEKRAGNDQPRPVDSLSRREYDAAVRYRNLHNDRLKAIGSADALYDAKTHGEGDEEAHAAWCRDITEDYIEVRKAIQSAQNETRTANLWAALDLIILRDMAFPEQVGALRILCNAMARHWKIT